MFLAELKQELQDLTDPKRAKHSQRFFKTAKGEYAEGDKFLGIKVPIMRQVAKKYLDLGLGDLKKLLKTKIHNYRFIALVILTERYKKATLEEKKKIYDFYLDNTSGINNWDLVDVSAPKIVGVYLLDKPKERKILYQLARSKDLWERRIAILSTFAFIRANDFEDALKISEILVNDSHDLIHKAVGWMLREIGKKDQVKEEAFLKRYYKTMPRVMLRYAIEKFVWF
jgi:3-methyladenine DNA glycosylase AlkD